jgi:hypothetical protein
MATNIILYIDTETNNIIETIMNGHCSFGKLDAIVHFIQNKYIGSCNAVNVDLQWDESTIVFLRYTTLENLVPLYKQMINIG